MAAMGTLPAGSCVVYIKIRGQCKVCLQDDEAMEVVASAVFAVISNSNETELLELPSKEYRKWLFTVKDPLKFFCPTIFEWTGRQLILQKKDVANSKTWNNIRWNYIQRVGRWILMNYRIMLRKKSDDQRTPAPSLAYG